MKSKRPFLRNRRFKLMLIQAALACIGLTSTSAEDMMSSCYIPADPGHWNTENDVEFVEFQGRHAIKLQGGFHDPGMATLKDLEISDGTIEFDMWIEFEHSLFAGLRFRLDDAREKCEYIYFRPQANNQYNAFQYYPHYKKDLVWQLHGQHQRAVDLPVGDWFHFQIDLQGRTMTCTFDDDAYPFFYTDHLTSGSDQGLIQFISSSQVYVSNIKLCPQEQEPLTPLEVRRWDLDPRYLDTWKVCAPLILNEGEERVTPDHFQSMHDDLVIQAEDQGMISFTRYIDQPAWHSAVLATVDIEAEAACTKTISMGYSDRIDLYLNGELVFSGDNTFMSEHAKMRSRVHLGNDFAELRLTPGSNQLQAIVYERAGGWGMIMQLSDLYGIKVIDPQ